MSARILRILCACLPLLAGGCAVSGVGVGGDVGLGYGSGYYEPYGYDYGGWSSGYYVGPWNGRDHRGWHDDHPHDRPGSRSPSPRAPAYRPPAGGRSMPSIPSRPRSH